MVMRVEQQHGFRPRITHFAWDGFDRLIEVHAADGSRWRYTYDALGRRTSKRCTHAAQKAAYPMPSKDLQEEHYLWEGARLAQQSKRYADGTQEFFGWHYAPDSFTPLAVSHQKNQDEAQLLYVVSDHLGTPRELVDGTGRMVWAAQLQTWGKLNRLWQSPAANEAEHPLQLDLRFPNQWHDAESGLHYNYQRYYDPESGQYLSPDPIGLAGGMRVQGYVDNPGVGIDPLGLSECPPIRAKDLSGGPHTPGTPDNVLLSRAARTRTPQGRWSSQEAIREAAMKYDTTKGGVQVVTIKPGDGQVFHNPIRSYPPQLRGPTYLINPADRAIIIPMDEGLHLFPIDSTHHQYDSHFVGN
jgi:RHS repeat-associated protein